MNNLFNMDNPFFSTLSKLYDMLFLSVLWVIFSIPIITIGPASTALYYSVVKVIRKERGYLFREFVKSFRMNFKRGAIVGVLLTVVLVILFFDLSYAIELLAVDSNKGSLLVGVFIAITFLVISIGTYAFPILSRFEMTVRQLLKAAVFMSMRHIPFTILMVVVFIISVVVVVFLVPIMIFLIPALSVLINSFMMEKIFKKYMPQAESSPEETGKDEWYLD